MEHLIEYVELDSKYSEIAEHWKSFLSQHYKSNLKIKVVFDSLIPTIFDSDLRKFKIDFMNDSENYKKIKSNITSEPLSRALGSGKKGLRVLDLSAGLGIDAVFLAQLGYEVTALERNPLLYLALSQAKNQCSDDYCKNINFVFTDAKTFLKSTENKFDICYFDPMFPQKKKSALPKQEMVIFKNLVGSDDDATEVLSLAIMSKKFKRCSVKRPLSAEPLLPTSGSIVGKIIRYDIYGGID